MAVVIQQPDPLGGLNSLAEGYSEGRDKAMALALAKQKQASDERFKTRQLDLQQSQVESENRSRDVSTKIAQEQHDYEVSIRPMLERLTQAQITGQLTQNDVLTATLEAQKIDNDVKARLAKLGIPEKQAEAALQEVRQRVQTEIAQMHAAEAQQRSTDANTATTNALRPGQVAAQGAQTDLARAEAAAARHAANAPYPTPGGAAAARTKEQDAADLQLGRQTVDDLLQYGMPDKDGNMKPVAPADVERLVRSSQSYSSEVKLQLIAYIRSKTAAKPTPTPTPQTTPSPMATMRPNRNPAFSPPQPGLTPAPNPLQGLTSLFGGS